MKGLLVLSGLVVAAAGGTVAVHHLRDRGNETAVAALDCTLRENSWRWACNKAKDPVDLEKPSARAPEPKISESKPMEAKPADAGKAQGVTDPETTGSLATGSAAGGGHAPKRAARAASHSGPSGTAQPAAAHAEPETMMPPEEDVVDAEPATPAADAKPVSASVPVDRAAAAKSEPVRRIEAATEPSAADSHAVQESKERSAQASDEPKPRTKRNSSLSVRKAAKPTREARPAAPARSRIVERERPRPTRERPTSLTPSQSADIAAGRLQVIPPGYAQIVRGSDGNYYALPLAR